MMPGNVVHLPGWVYLSVWSVITVLTAYVIGRIVSRTVCQRLSVWASKTAWKWDDLIVEALRRGFPIWSVLSGLYIAIGFWELPPHFHDIFVRILYVLTWLSITMIGAALAGKLIVLYGGQFQQAMPVTSLTENIAKIVIVVLGLLMILNGLGISIAPILTALGVGGLAVALAIQDTLSNLFSGFYLTMTKHVRVGDYVKLESGQEGYVDDIGWRATKIRMLPNNIVLVPNGKLGGSIITNYNLPSRELDVVVEVGVGYQSDLARVERITCEVATKVMRSVPGGVPSFEPVVRYHTFGESRINFTVVMRAKEFVDQFLIKHEFVKRLHVRYQQEGITIPFPTRIVYTKDSA